jgi:S-adenosylmethionine/arginine decarboxylase-like enzyme
MLEHKVAIVKAKVNSPPFDETQICEWLRKLVADLGMTVLKGPYSVYSDKEGNKGLTAMVIIDTSHIALHCWDEESPGLLRLDVYTCAALDMNVIWDAITEFDVVSKDYVLLDTDSDTISILEKSI